MTIRRVQWISAALLFAVALWAASATALPTAQAKGIVPDSHEIAAYAGESGFSVFVHADGSLYTAGSNGSGELGRGGSGDGVKIEPTTVKVLANAAMADTGKSGFVLAVTRNNELYAWGSNDYGQAGGNVTAVTAGNNVTKPQRVEMPAQDKIVAVQAGARHSLVLTENGMVYAFGHNNYGQLGLGMDAGRQSLTSVPAPIDSQAFGGQKITEIAACEFTSYALAENGDLYGWGTGNNGLLLGENGSASSLNAPICILRGVKKVSAQSTNVMALRADGTAVAWGSNNLGQLGVPRFTELFSASPLVLDAFYTQDGQPCDVNVHDVLCGGVTNFVLSDRGEVFAFGSGGAGELGFSVRAVSSPFIDLSRATAPTKIVFYAPLSVSDNAAVKGKVPLDKSQTISVEITGFLGSIGNRTFATDSEGQTWAWGDNDSGLVCSGNIAAVDAPVRATLYRDENYDQEVRAKNYMRRPIIGLSIIFGLALVWIVTVECKRYRALHRKKEDKKSIEQAREESVS